jgi:hypothetical protein
MTQGNGQRRLFLFDQRKKLAGGQTNHPSARRRCAEAVLAGIADRPKLRN